MKLQFKHQKFQADAAKAVVDVFAGQPYLTPTYMMDRGYGQQTMTDDADFTGWRNERIVPELSDKLILEHLQKVQRTNQIKPSDKLEGRYNLTIEMETGVGKTYTYIKTMYELNKHYGWSKFIVVVPSIAIREGVYKSFQVTQEHFAEEYGKKIRFFIYNSAQLTEIDRFASDSAINVMIINVQAFNKSVDANEKLESGKRADKNAAIIFRKLDNFRSRRPIDIIAKTNPILIIDEPQSVEGPAAKKNLKLFSPLLTLRYSATHKADSIYNMVYRLDAMEAYNKRLVKKIAVKGITESGSTATEGFVYLESINLSKADPTATIQFDYKGASGIRKKTATVGIGYNLYDNSGNLDEYKVGFVVKSIDGRDNSVEFLNGVKIFAGDVIGKVSGDQLRRIQIRETILSHLERERQLFHKGIKVLSLFFIDEVAKYKQYDEVGHPFNGIYAALLQSADVTATLLSFRNRPPAILCTDTSGLCKVPSAGLAAPHGDVPFHAAPQRVVDHVPNAGGIQHRRTPPRLHRLKAERDGVETKQAGIFRHIVGIIPCRLRLRLPPRAVHIQHQLKKALDLLLIPRKLFRELAQFVQYLRMLLDIVSVHTFPPTNRSVFIR